MIMKIRKRILFNIMKIKIQILKIILIMNIQMSLMIVIAVKNMKIFRKKMKKSLQKIIIILVKSFIKILNKSNKIWN